MDRSIFIDEIKMKFLSTIRGDGCRDGVGYTLGKLVSAIDCTKHRRDSNENGITFVECFQVGANGHPCPLHLNPPSVADFP